MTDLFITQEDFAVESAGILHLQTRHQMVVFALHALIMVAVAFGFAAAMVLL